MPNGNFHEGEQGFALTCLEEVRVKLTLRQRMNFAFKGLL
jgi:hypothetical protein